MLDLTTALILQQFEVSESLYCGGCLSMPLPIADSVTAVGEVSCGRGQQWAGPVVGYW